MAESSGVSPQQQLRMKRDRALVLFGGTRILQHTPDKHARIKTPDGGCLAYVLRTGFETAQGAILVLSPGPSNPETPPAGSTLEGLRPQHSTVHTGCELCTGLGAAAHGMLSCGTCRFWPGMPLFSSCLPAFLCFRLAVRVRLPCSCTKEPVEHQHTGFLLLQALM